MASGEVAAVPAAYALIVLFLARSVIVTDGNGRRSRVDPLCTDDETRFLVSVVNALNVARELPGSDIDRFYALFIRASRSRYANLRHATLLREALRRLESGAGAVE